MIDLSQPEVAFAVDAVRQAAAVTREVQREMTGHLTKEDRSPVTVADFAAQAVVGFLLDHRFPSDPLVAEEDATALRDEAQEAICERVAQFAGTHIEDATPASVCDWIDRGNGTPGPRFWTLDPVDGTKGFLRGDQYAVALALLEGGHVSIGVLGCPNLTPGGRPEAGGPGALVVAVRGQGAWAAPLDRTDAASYQPLHVSDVAEPAGARLLRSFEAGHTNVDQAGAVAKALGATAEPVLMDSQAKYAVLAAGQGDVLLRLLSPAQPEYQERIWDQAAGSIVVEEAGGCITDLDGVPLDFGHGRSLTNNRGIAATNGALHDAVLAAVEKAGHAASVQGR